LVASQILIVMIGAIALTIFAERRQIQAPLLLAAVGLGVSFIPALPRTELAPEILLGIVLPPLLYSAALDFSFFSFMRRLGQILNLGVLLVIATALAASVVTGWLLPALSVPMALLLGAVIAPPDAVSAVAIGRKLSLPSRLMTVLKGESLINDAAALTLFAVAVATTVGTPNFIASPWLYFLYASVVGVIVGIIIGAFAHRIRSALPNPTLVTALAVLVPFTAYLLAEELNASGVMAVVFAGFVIGHNSARLGYAGRIQEREVWRVIDALLEAFVFAYMGLQLRFVLEDAAASGFDNAELAIAALALLATVIVVRIVWILVWGLIQRYRHRRWIARGRPMRRRRGPVPEPLSWRENAVLSWSGMRGVVTLAAAAGTPLVTAAGLPVEGREAVVPLAFAVAIGTLLLQGLTLPWLIKRLDIDNSDEAEYVRKQLAHANLVARKASVDVLAGYRTGEADPRTVAIAERLFERISAADDSAFEAGFGGRREVEATGIARAMLAGQRQALVAERDAERLDDEVLRAMLQTIDMEQAVLASRGGAPAAKG